MAVIDRITNETKFEASYMPQITEFLLNQSNDSFLSRALFEKALVSNLYGYYANSSLSKMSIQTFIERCNINTEELKKHISEFRTLNELFTRELKEEARSFQQDKNILSSSAEGRVTAYQTIDKDNVLQVKGMSFTLEELLGSKELANEYHEGTYVLTRLAPEDYHWMHYEDDGIVNNTHIVQKGTSYFPVSRMALKKKVALYCQNKRQSTEFVSENFGDVIIIRVAAFNVGSFLNHSSWKDGDKVSRGQHDTTFEIGGSTGIKLYKKGQVQIDPDILKNTQEGNETYVRLGTRIGKSL